MIFAENTGQHLWAVIFVRFRGDNFVTFGIDVTLETSIYQLEGKSFTSREQQWLRKSTGDIVYRQTVQWVPEAERQRRRSFLLNGYIITPSRHQVRHPLLAARPPNTPAGKPGKNCLHCGDGRTDVDVGDDERTGGRVLDGAGATTSWVQSVPPPPAWVFSARLNYFSSGPARHCFDDRKRRARCVGVLLPVCQAAGVLLCFLCASCLTGCENSRRCEWRLGLTAAAAE